MIIHTLHNRIKGKDEIEGLFRKVTGMSVLYFK